MANSDKNILITPNVNAATGTLPNIVFRGADNTPITMRVLDNGTLSYEAAAGQLFSIAPGLTGTIFSVNDISGIPSIEVLDTGLVKLTQYNGQVVIGGSAAVSTAELSVFPSAAASIGVIVRGVASQSGNLQEWRNSADTVLASISSIGNITAPAIIPSGSTVPSNGMYLSAANTLNFATNTTNRLGIDSSGNATFTGSIIAPAATTTLAPLRIPHGTAPTSPTNGDIWTTTTGLFVTVNGATVGPLGVSYSAPTIGSTLISSGATVTTISGLTLDNTTLTGTLTANAGVGAVGQYLESTGTGVRWTTVSGYSAPTIGSTLISSGATVTTISGLTLTSPTVNTPTLTLATASSTTDARMSWDTTNKKIQVGNGTSAIDFSSSTLVTNAQTIAYTLVLSDKDKLVEINNAAAVNLTVPLNSSAAYPIGTQINVLQTGAGQVTIVPAVGVTLNGTPGLKLRAQWSSATLIKRNTDTWVAVGDLAP